MHESVEEPRVVDSVQSDSSGSPVANMLQYVSPQDRSEDAQGTTGNSARTTKNQ